jgi:hypothetical protein
VYYTGQQNYLNFIGVLLDMRFRKETVERKEDSTNLSRKEQVVVSRIKRGYT